MALPRHVQKAYVLAKDAGHRGPVLGAYLITGFDDQPVVATVTPSGVTVVGSESGVLLAQHAPSGDDAFTVSTLIPLQAASGDTRMCGLVLGCQSGRIVLLQIASHVVEVHSFPLAVSSITCVAPMAASLLIAGTATGQVLVYDPVRHPATPSVSLSAGTAAVTAICCADASTVWVAVDNFGLVKHTCCVDNTGLVSLDACPQPITFPDMQAVTSISYSANQRLLICLSSCLEVFLIDSQTAALVHQYPASLMTCGAALSTIASVEIDAVPGSTFLILGGIDGSFSVRELSKRERDGKLQCVLHRCIDRLAPQPKSGEPLSLDPADGCPLTSLFVVPELDVCVVGDASCAVYVVGLKLVPMTPAPTPAIDEDPGDSRRDSIDQETVLEPSLAGDDSELVERDAARVSQDGTEDSIQLTEELAQDPTRTEQESVKEESKSGAPEVLTISAESEVSSDGKREPAETEAPSSHAAEVDENSVEPEGQDGEPTSAEAEAEPTSAEADIAGTQKRKNRRRKPRTNN